MNLMSGLIVFLMIWMVVLFMVLPWRVHISGKVNSPGHASSAPDDSYILHKFLITTTLAMILWFVADWLISSNYFSFRL